MALNIITHNPYRLLGVFPTSPRKELVANVARIKANIRVNRMVSFSTDLDSFLDCPQRTLENIANAEAKLTLPKDQILYAQFWFVKITPLDDVAFNNLVAGEIDKAEGIWRKRECASSLQNRIMCALIRKNYESAITCAEVLYGNIQYINQLISAITGSGGNIDITNLAFTFLDFLCEEVGANKLLSFITNKTWKSHIGEKAVQPLVDNIQGAIDIAKTSKGKDSMARLNAGVNLMENTRNSLLQLKEFLSTTDLQYQIIADKLGLEILQCGIDYFKDSDESDAALKAMRLLESAKSIVVGQIAKDRCKENINSLQKIIDNLPPSEVFAEDRAIHEELRNYCLQPDKICHAVTLLNNTKTHIQSIKYKLGASNAYYLKISTQVVNNALINVIAEVNDAQSIFSTDKNGPNATLAAIRGITHVKSVLEEAWKATMIMDSFDMESSYQNGRYRENRSILKGLCEQLGVSTYTPTPRPPQRKPTPTPDPGSSTDNNPPENGQTGSDNRGIWAVVLFGICIIICIAAAAGVSGGFVGISFAVVVFMGIWIMISDL